MIKNTLVVLLGLSLFTSCEKKEQEKVTTIIDDKAIADEKQTSDWLAYGRTHNERRFSPLDDVNVGNVANLKVDWFIDLPNDVGLVSTPLVVNGVMYFTGTMNIIRAVDAASGKLIWEFDPKVRDAIKGKRQVGWAHSRGISFYDGKVFTATWDGRLIGIDAKTGKEIWTAVTFDPNRSLNITGAPKAFKGLVLIGNGGSENGPARGFVTAYNADTGKEVWKFYVVPGNPADGFENEAMEMAAKTWNGEWWKNGGGGNVWHGYTYDADLDVLYFGTGNGGPWNPRIRSPKVDDNLFLCSIIAVKPETGEYLWHYQTTPGEAWDYNSTMDIVLADLKIDGKDVKAILHAPKNGFFYVINRETGKLISAEPFTEVTWAKYIDLKTGRPVLTDGARYDKGPIDIAPDSWGGHSWQAMAYSPQSGLAYIPTLHHTDKYSDEGVVYEGWESKEFSGGIGVGLSPADKQLSKYPSTLEAIDPVTQKHVWSIPQETFWNAGVLATGGNLVFQGRSDGKLLAYNAKTGEIVWTFDTGLGISAPPITYKINGRQYISLLVGFGGGYARGGLDAYNLGWSYRTHMRRLVTFSLEGKATMPALPARHFPKPIVPDDFVINEEKAAEGVNEYWKCFICHGDNMFSGGMAPDLRASPIPLNKEAFTSVVRDGLKNTMGMPSFPDITDEQIENLMHFIRKRAKETMPDYEKSIKDNAVEK